MRLSSIRMISGNVGFSFKTCIYCMCARMYNLEAKKVITMVYFSYWCNIFRWRIYRVAPINQVKSNITAMELKPTTIIWFKSFVCVCVCLFHFFFLYSVTGFFRLVIDWDHWYVLILFLYSLKSLYMSFFVKMIYDYKDFS